MTVAGPVAASGAVAVAAAGKARSVSVKNDLYAFTYAYPAAAGAIPALKARFEGEIASGQRELAAAAKEGRAEAGKDGFSFNGFESGTSWQVVAELPGWLSLSAAIFEYTGGAHPNHGYAALLWDKAAGRERKVEDLFASKAALARALTPAFCAELNRQRASRRGQPVDPASTDSFDQCIDPTGSTLILGSADHQHFTRIGVLIGPYEAGSYAEGSYEVTLPVTPAVLAAVRPEFRTTFAVKR